MADDLRFDEISYGPAVWAAIPVLAITLLVFLVLRMRRGSMRPPWPWALPQGMLLVAITVWYVIGLGANSLLTLAICTLLIVVGALMAIGRPLLEERLPEKIITACSVIGTIVAGVCTMELMWNERWWLMNPTYLALEAVIVAGLMLAAWLVGGRRGIGPAIVLAALAFIGLTQHFVVTFRGTSLLPSDILAAGTAMSVSGGYTYGLSNGMLRGFASLAVGLGFASQLSPSERPFHVRDALCALAVAALTVLLVVVPDYESAFGVTLDYWFSRDSYAEYGFLSSFITAFQDMSIRPPEGYSPEAAKEASSSLAARLQTTDYTSRRAAAEQQFEAKQPNIIVIQNESFCDLSNFNGLNNGYEGPHFWNQGLDDALMRGAFAVSVFGGGTCNTEYESLTGNSLAFLGPGKYPFSMYNLKEVSSIPRQLSQAGYHNIGMHPNLASNWNRDHVYSDLGFDEFVSIDDFEGAEEYHTHVSDRATYEKSLDLIRQHDEPVFVFDVTMQNHSGYNTNSIPEDELRNYDIPEVEDYVVPETNEFLACVDESDRAFEQLIAELKELDEPTVVVMFGDHHPWVSEHLNDGIFPDEDSLTHAERIHQTSYVVWANYDVAQWKETHQHNVDDTSADMLGAMVLDAIGAPLTEFQKAQLGARKDISAINADGVLGADGSWHPIQDPGVCEDTYHQLEMVEYDQFGSKL